MSDGSVAILNCADGDAKLTFDSGDESEVQRARDVVGDMMRRGYTVSLVVEGEIKAMEKVVDFDPEADEYIIETQKPGPKKRVKARGRRAIAVAPTAGGGLCCRAFPVRSSDLQDLPGGTMGR
jgi:hypothetical protein